MTHVLIRVGGFLVALLMLASCSTFQANVKAAQGASDPIAGIAQFTIADLTAADARAVAAGDAAGHACYPVLAGVVQQAQALTAAKGGVAGPIDLFEAGRVLAKQGPGSVDAVAQQINVGCAALFVDAQATLIKLGLVGAAVVPKF